MITPTQNRRPRYRRLGSDVSFLMTPRDVQILTTVHSYRLLTSEHLQTLTNGSPQNILRRLQLLYQAGYLDRIHPPRTNGGGSAKMIYALTNKGARTLQKEGVIQNRSKTDLNSQNNQLHEFSVRHRLLVSHIRATLTVACKSCPGLELVTWREGHEIFDRIEVALPNGYAKIPVAPDGFFALQDAKGRTHYFVEADRGSMQIARFVLKLKAYAAYYRQQKHTEKFNIRHFRVLTVTSSDTRCKNLVNAAAGEEDLSKLGWMFLFSTEKQLPLAQPDRVFEKIWTKPGTKDLCSLFDRQNPTKPNERGTNGNGTQNRN